MKSCMDNLSVCKAVCCTQLPFKINFPRGFQLQKGTILKIRPKVELSKDEIWYYQLHGVPVKDGVLFLEVDDVYPTKKYLIFRKKCKLLTDDFKCSGHPVDKPKVCQELNWDNIKEARDRYYIDPECIYKEVEHEISK